MAANPDLSTLVGAEPHAGRIRVVILGAGFGGLEAAKGLARVDADLTVIDQHNYHLFQPLLYQVATAALSPANVAAPIRGILRAQANATVLLAGVIGIYPVARLVDVREHTVPYDQLVVATGARTGIPGTPIGNRLRPA